jgi:DMSO reductase anchor subunit
MSRPEAMVPKAEPRSYYGRPVIKPPVWKPEIPWYFFAGGLTGASATLAWVADANGNTRLGRRAGLVTMVAGTASPVLLIRDLGRPERFLNMLRVFKPTSPMSMGSWLLALTASAAGLATARETLGLFPRLGRLGRAVAALSGLPLATYTAVLIANTAVPAWHEARRELPFVFAGSAAASAGAAAAIVTPVRDAGPARRLVVLGALLEEGATQLMERRLGELGDPYREGEARTYARLSRAFTLGGAALVGSRGRTRLAAVAGGKLVLAGAVLKRWSVFKAGVRSATEPRYTVGPQRTRLEARSNGTAHGDHG